MRVNAIAGCFVLGGLVLGCANSTTSGEPTGTSPTGGQNPTGGNNPTGGSNTPPTYYPAPPAFPEGTGQIQTEVEYPAGPYGVSVGSVIENYQFVGYADAVASTKTMQLVQLSDFYNPDGKGVFPDKSPYGAGNAKPVVILVDIASVWCTPCNNEAHYTLPPLHKLYAPCGGQFFLNLADGPTPGITATSSNLRNWTAKYKVDFPSVIDPEYKLAAVFAADAYPNNIVIDTRTMKIVDRIAGAEPHASCVGGPNQYGDCSTSADCPSSKCQINSIWASFEKQLDKTRTGCTVQ